MSRVIIDVLSGGSSLIRNYNELSILKREVKIELASGKNILADLPYGFYFGHDGSNISSIILDDYDTSRIIDMSCMFDGCCSLKELDLSKFNTSNVLRMDWLFCGCRNLKELNLSSFDTINVTDITSIFQSCMRLEKLDLSNFDMSNVRYMGSMFYGCYCLRHIRCKKAFKEWCLINKNIINLPLSMCEGGEGVWDIID